ncbi:hypothetical protein GCM10022226_22000 [Sphaerisporangium flaviroseum]|uniref:Uncharacterized protein n=1 Tax=Sphaerisporangium flaviroseum TaxID=509199 RepID=A0ABP7HW43_9ACTN
MARRSEHLGAGAPTAQLQLRGGQFLPDLPRPLRRQAVTRREVLGYAQDLVALSQVQQSKPKPASPGPVRVPARPPRR